MPSTSTPGTTSRRSFVLLVAACSVITGCGNLGYDVVGRDGGVGVTTPHVDGGLVSIDAAVEIRADGGDAAIAPSTDSGAALDPDAGPGTEPDAGPADAGIISGCTPRCTRDEYCATPEGMCTAVGTCSARPDSCPDVFDPVRGCDGIDYSSGCVAARAGTSVAVGGGV